MEMDLSKYLRENEHVQWQGTPAKFPLMEQGVKFQILRKWILTVAVTVGLLVGYLSLTDSDTRRNGLVGMIILVGIAVMVSPLLEFAGTRQLRYWITNQRVIVMTRDKTTFGMELGSIDDYRVVTDITAQDCLVLGSVLFPEIRKQLRWRACHPKVEIQAQENSASGLVLYGLSNAAAAVALLEKSKLAHAA